MKKKNNKKVRKQSVNQKNQKRWYVRTECNILLVIEANLHKKS